MASVGSVPPHASNARSAMRGRRRLPPAPTSSPTMRARSGSSHAVAAVMTRSTRWRASSTSSAARAMVRSIDPSDVGGPLKGVRRARTCARLQAPCNHRRVGVVITQEGSAFQLLAGCMDPADADELKGFGLSTYESAAYGSLLRLGQADANVVAHKAGIPFGRVYDVLNGLVERGLLTMHEGRPKTYHAVAPRAVM